MLHVVCYISNSMHFMSPKELERLFSYAKNENAKKDITGLLLFSEGTFVQVLEGENKTVNFLFESIMRDRRHDHVTIMMDRPIEKRLFDSYETNSVLFGDLQGKKKLKSRILLPSATQYTKSVWAILKPFFSLRQIGVRGMGLDSY